MRTGKRNLMESLAKRSGQEIEEGGKYNVIRLLDRKRRFKRYKIPKLHPKMGRIERIFSRAPSDSKEHRELL